MNGIAERQTEELLRQSEERFRRLVEVMPVAVYVCDTSGRIQSYNKRAVELWGRAPKPGGTAQRYCGSLRLYSPEGKLVPHEDSLMAEVLRTGIEARDLEVTIERPDGTRITVLVNIVPLRNSEGELIGAMNCFQDITDRKRSEEALHMLSCQLLRLGDEERRRLARELHDGTAQLLAGLCMSLSVVSESADIRDPRARAALAESDTLAHQCLRQIRTVSYLLHPPELDELGLEPALSLYIDGFTQRSGIRVDAEVSPDLRRLPQAVETTVFRVVQECLTNIHRHSGSNTARVRLIRGPSNLVLEVEDAGGGIRDNAPSGVGTASMRQRVQELNGRLKIDSHPGRTIVQATIPLQEFSA
jgi:signal transduction histidine kinase